MLLLLIRLLSHFGVHVPAAFSYSSTRMLLAAITTLLITIFVGPYFIRKLYALKTGQSIRVEDCPVLVELHKKKKNTPTMGGILILFSMLVSLILWMDLTSIYSLLFFVTTIYLGALGGFDDYLKMKHKNAKGLSARKKFGLQILLAAVIGVYLIWFPASLEKGRFFHPPVAKMQTHKIEDRQVYTSTETLDATEYMAHYFLPFKKGAFFVLSGAGLILGLLFTIFVITGSSNAVNLTDGLDGLAAGTLVMSAGVLGLFAFLSNNLEMSRYLNILYVEGSGEIAVYLFAMIGACLGFLWYNGYPAQVFMGDTGSLALGGVLGLAAVLLRREFLLALCGGIFVVEALSVILQVLSYRYCGKKRIFLCSPLHHHFEYKGWPETKVVLRFWIIALILSMVAIISLKIQ
ncbi:MAG: phospho-N-acetylmuramoyl-pentapeptide-transferase [Simkaniaceae bacterium]|nr:phospho-N-acetylmuramoyl-pentapeptide-transferase [Candidatus Sacchlamyda saccharinae]